MHIGTTAAGATDKISPQPVHLQPIVYNFMFVFELPLPVNEAVYF